MFTLEPDKCILVKLNIPNFDLPILVNGEEINDITDLCEASNIWINGNNIDLSSVLLEVLSNRLLNDESLWDCETDEFVRREAEKTLIALNFIDANSQGLSLFVSEVSHYKKIIETGLEALGYCICRIRFHAHYGRELVMEILYERAFRKLSFKIPSCPVTATEIPAGITREY